MKLWNQYNLKKSLKNANSLYGEYYQNNIKKLTELLQFLHKEYLQIVVWGAGLKGQAFLFQCDDKKNYIDFVVDMDKRKQNHPLPTGHYVYDISKINYDSVILVVNINYYSSICFDLINNGFDIKKFRIISLDQYIQDKFSLQQIQDNTIWERKKYYD